MMNEPRCVIEGYAFIDKDGNWCIEENAPDWAKEEFNKFMETVNPTPDDNGIITNY